MANEISDDIAEFVKQVRIAMAALDWKKGKLAQKSGRNPNTITRALKGLGGVDSRAIETRNRIVEACQKAGYEFPHEWQRGAA